jgi:hypothetical protein
VHAPKRLSSSEDLFSYCYLLTILERLRLIDPEDVKGARLMLVQSQKEALDEMKVYEKRLSAEKLPTTTTNVIRVC